MPKSMQTRQGLMFFKPCFSFLMSISVTVRPKPKKNHNHSLRKLSSYMYFIQCSYKLEAESSVPICGVHKPCPLPREETMPTVHVVTSRFRLCTSLVPRPMSMVFGPGTRLHVMWACIQHQKMASFAMDSNQCCEWLLIDQGEFEAMRTLRAPCCHKHQFHAKMMVST